MPVMPGNRTHSRTLALAMFLIIILIMAELSAAGEEGTASSEEPSPPRQAPASSASPPLETPPQAAEAPLEEAEPAPDGGYFMSFIEGIDATHDRIERNILDQTIRLDDFFGGEKTENLRPTGYVLRWRNACRVKRGGEMRYGASARLSLVLSKTSERLQLTIAGEDEPDPLTQTLPKDPGNPGFDRTTPTTHFANTELRYELIRKPTMKLFLGAGVRLNLPIEVFVRSRFDYIRELSDVSLIRFGETIFVKNTDLLGETTEISLERLLSKGTILRLASAATASQEIEGLEWGSELTLVREVSPRTAITLTGGGYGNTRTAPLVQFYRVLARYRRNFLRDWLFFELEPEISWPRNRDGNYPATLAFTFRLEIMFRGTDRRELENSPKNP